jgi:putative copper resistance protein D
VAALGMTTAVAPKPAAGSHAPTVRPVRLIVGSILVGVVVMALLLWTGDGRPVASPPGIPDAGDATEWGLPVLRVLTDLAAILTIGLLLAGAVLVPARDGVLQGARLRWTRAARWSALGWAAAVVAEVVLTLSDVLGQPVPSVLDPALLWSFVRDIEVGRALLVQAILALVVGLCAYVVRTTTGAALVGLVALIALVPPTLTSHAGTAVDHAVAVSSLMVHVVAVSLWCGGLAALVLLGTADRRPFPVAVPRFSTLALWCAVAVAASGVVSAWVRLGDAGSLVTTSYGRLVMLKVALMAVLSAFGLWHRRKSLPALGSDPTRLRFLRLAAVEVLVMAATVGVAVALSRTPPPVSGEVPLGSLSPAQLLLGFALPPAPDLVNLLWGQARIDGFWLVVVALLGALYASGLRVMRRSGDAWSAGRTLNWYVGVLLLLLSTQTGLATYAHVMFSAHMAQHMVLVMLVPIFLVLGAPFTLALRTLPRNAGQLGPREWLTAALHSRTVALLANPIVASAVFLAGFYGLYYTSLYAWLMPSHWGHIAMNVYFVLSGFLFFWALIGVDPGPKRPPYLVRMVVMIIVMPLHSFFAISMMMTTTVMAETFYAALQRPFAVDLLADQHLGASIGWASGDVPMLIVMIAMFIQWVGADEREARRSDRKQERAATTGQGTDELADYNAYLASLHTQDPNGSPRG